MAVEGRLSLAKKFQPARQFGAPPDEIEYSEKYEDADFEYRHVTLDAGAWQRYQLLCLATGSRKWDPVNKRWQAVPRRLSEEEWRNELLVEGSRGWENYAIYDPEPRVLLFRRNKVEVARRTYEAAWREREAADEERAAAEKALGEARAADSRMYQSLVADMGDAGVQLVMAALRGAGSQGGGREAEERSRQAGARHEEAENAYREAENAYREAEARSGQADSPDRRVDKLCEEALRRFGGQREEDVIREHLKLLWDKLMEAPPATGGRNEGFERAELFDRAAQLLRLYTSRASFQRWMEVYLVAVGEGEWQQSFDMAIRFHEASLEAEAIRKGTTVDLLLSVVEPDASAGGGGYQDGKFQV